MLGIASLDPDVAAQHLASVGLQVAVGIAGQDQLRRRDDEHAVLEHLHRARLDQSVEEHGARVGAAVVVGVLEHDDLPDRGVLAGRLRSSA